MSILNAFPSARSVAMAGVVLALGAASALAASPFEPFAGSWRGGGRIYDIHGKSEAVTCRSTISPSSDGIAANLALVCASDSYRVDFHSDLFTDGQSLHGNWTETTRSASGDIHGQIGGSEIQATASAPGFNANIVAHVISGKRMDVSLNATGVSIDRVQVSMRR
jgi:hypothetical protein